MNTLINYAAMLYHNPFVKNVCVPAASGALLMPAITAIHELGHAVAFKILFQNAHPTISLGSYGFGGGAGTSPNFSGVPQLSLIGRLLSPDRVDIIVNAAGTIAEMVTKLAIINGFNSSMRYALLIYSSIDSAVYACSPLIASDNDDGDDFQNIRRISPLFFKTLLGANVGLATYIFAKAIGNFIA